MSNRRKIIADIPLLLINNVKFKTMPCRSDYMEPTQQERESSKVISFLKEIGEDVGEYSTTYGRRETINQDTAKLCELCQKVDVTKYSLELQIWWRDHQEADRARLKKEIEATKKAKDKDKAIAKLTPYERDLLGL